MTQIPHCFALVGHLVCQLVHLEFDLPNPFAVEMVLHRFIGMVEELNPLTNIWIIVDLIDLSTQEHY